MKSIKKIETSVCKHFKVELNDIYSSRKSVYPINGAKLALIYLLYVNGHKSYKIARKFGFDTTLIYRYCGQVSNALKSDTKIKEDIELINNILNSK